MLALLSAAILALITIADHGRVFQPALSPDGGLVAYAADEGGTVSLYVAPAAGGAARKVVEIGQGHQARRLALLALSQGPWSPDGVTLLCLRVAAARVADEREPRAELWTLLADGSELKRVEAATGTIEAAVWSAKADTSRLIFAHRDALDGKVTRVVALDLAEADPTKQAREVAVFDQRDPTYVLELASAPDGRWLAMLTLSGPREARVRRVDAVEIAADGSLGETRRMDYEGSPNFLRFSGDGQHLYFTDTEHAVMSCWSPAKRSLDADRTVDKVSFGLPVLDGAFAVARAPDGHLEAIEFKAGAPSARQRLGSGYVAVSAAGGKLALVRTGAPGAAVVIADLTPEALRAGDLGIGGGTGGSGGAGSGSTGGGAGGTGDGE